MLKKLKFLFLSLIILLIFSSVSLAVDSPSSVWVVNTGEGGVATLNADGTTLTLNQSITVGDTTQGKIYTTGSGKPSWVLPSTVTTLDLGGNTVTVNETTFGLAVTQNSGNSGSLMNNETALNTIEGFNKGYATDVTVRNGTITGTVQVGDTKYSSWLMSAFNDGVITTSDLTITGVGNITKGQPSLIFAFAGGALKLNSGTRIIGSGGALPISLGATQTSSGDGGSSAALTTNGAIISSDCADGAIWVGNNGLGSDSGVTCTVNLTDTEVTNTAGPGITTANGDKSVVNIKEGSVITGQPGVESTSDSCSTNINSGATVNGTNEQPAVESSGKGSVTVDSGATITSDGQYSVETTGSGTPPTINGGTYDPALDPSEVSLGSMTKVIITEDGYTYFPTAQAAENWAKENNISNPTIVDTKVVNGTSTSFPTGGLNGNIYSVSFDPENTPTYYNTNNTALQSVLLNLAIGTTNGTNQTYNNITPEQLNYKVNVTTGSGNSSSITFTSTNGTGASSTSNWKYAQNQYGSPATNQVPGETGYRSLVSSGSEAGNWFLVYKYNYGSVEVTKNGITTNQPQITWSDFALVYNGGAGNDTPVGIYSLEASAASAYYNTSVFPTNAPSGSTSFIVQSSTVQSVQIVSPTGTVAPSTYQVNLGESRTAQFNYLAKNTVGTAVQGSVVNWKLVNPNVAGSDNGLPYATVDPKTGLVTFLQAIPDGQVLLLSVTVDGAQSAAVALSTTGTLSYEGMTGITAVSNPVNTTDAAYNLVSNNVINNVVSSPVAGSLSATGTNGNPIVSFTSSSSSVLIFQNGNTWQAANLGTTPNSTDITVSYTYPGASAPVETTYTLNFVSNSVAPTGISAKETLNFPEVDSVPQNVSAKLQPDTVTTSVTPDAFTYTSSDESVAYVDTFGNVYPVAEGTCTVTSTYRNMKATTNVTVAQKPAEGTTISVDPTTLYLAPEGTENGTTSGTITATLTPADSAAVVDWSVDSDLVTLTSDGMQATVASTEDTGEAVVTASITLADGSTVSATTTVVVTGEDIVIDPLKTTITADSPDFYTVTVAPVANPAVDGSDTANIQKVSIFTWSNEGQTDMDCKIVEKGANGTYSYTFPVNNTPVNNYYDNAADITVQAYASTEAGSDGNMIMNTTWNYADCGWTEGVIVTPYVQDTGFITPSVGNGVTAGTTGEARQMEGVRLSSQYEGLDLVYDVHVQDIGWQEEVGTGVYAGTMGANLQIEAIHIKLAGPNASNYTIQYRAHVENIGWQDWVSAGEEAGTTGQGLQMEALEVRITPVNS